ncbi:GNAT family N-acetyltransferase [Catalinimonas sp. 4WD22]|uniref:GNAT family N-acetyltransferase n=1 Tax=Catalinimonas locisalis TaxID=3133978 RepID=UPI0031014370
MKITLLRKNAQDQDFISLVKMLDNELLGRDGKEHNFYAQYNTLSSIKYVVMAYDKSQPVGCGAIKAYSPQAMEVKRMYTLPAARGKGVASLILAELEKWAGELGYTSCVLETGKRQPEAIRLYEKNGYRQIPNYGQYVNVDNSVCFEKIL